MISQCQISLLFKDTSNKKFDEWAEMMGDEVMTVAMLDRLLHHSKVFNLSGESFRIQKEEED